MFIMAQTPLRDLKSEHNKLYLVVNQGDCRGIIEAYFKKVQINRNLETDSKT